MGALAQQGSDVEPDALFRRIAALEYLSQNLNAVGGTIGPNVRGVAIPVVSASNGIGTPDDLTQVDGGTAGMALSAASAMLTSTTAYAYKRTAGTFPDQSTVTLTVTISGPAGRVIGVRAARSKVGTNQTSQAVTLTGSAQTVTLNLTLTGEDKVDFGIENRSATVPGANCQVGDVIVAGAFTATEPTTTALPLYVLANGGPVVISDLRVRARTLVALGDSITAQSGLSSGQSYTTYGFLTTVLENLNGRLRLLSNAGISGNTTSDMLARLSPDVLAFQPGFCLVEGGVNDINNGLAGTTCAANLISICETLLANNIVPLLMDVLPDQRSSGNSSKTAEWGTANRIIRDYAARRAGVVFIPASQAYIDAGSVYPVPLPSVTSDGTHPNALGGKMLGAFVGQAIAAVVSPVPRFLSNSDAYNLFGLANGGNAMMYGSTGTAGTGTTGQVATNWTSSVTGAATAAMYKIPRRNSYAAWVASTPYALGDIVVPAGASFSGPFGYICTVAGTSSSSAPTFPGLGLTVTDGAVTWRGIDLPVTWRASTQFKVGQMVQATTSPGILLVAKAATGATGATEPSWPSTVGATVTDGSVTWVVVSGVVDGLAGDWQAFDLDGTAVTGTTVSTLNLTSPTITVATAGIANGDKLFFEVDVGVDLVRGLTRFAAQLDLLDSGGSLVNSYIVEDQNGTSVGNIAAPIGRTVTLRSPEFLFPATVNKATLTIKAQAVRMVGRVGQVLVRKV